MSARSYFDNTLRRRPEDHERQRQLTPSYILEPVRALLGGIELDPCTEPDNPTGAARFYCPPADGASLPWEASTVFCNPPYGESRERWVRRCIEAGLRGCRVVLLMPAATETRIGQLALREATSVLFIQARVTFELLRPNRRREAASHASALFAFNLDLSPLEELGLGVAMRADGREQMQRRMFA